jgi:magnesium transporter
MNEENKSTIKKAGLPPGSLVHIGNHKPEKTRVTVLDYDVNEFTETEYQNIEDCFFLKDKKTVTWINIDGLQNTEMIAKLGEHFELHPLILEDILNTHHRPKAEPFDNYTFLTLKMLGISKDKKNFTSEQISFILGKTWIITFQERQGDVFDAVRERLRSSLGNLRKTGSDYLLYRLVDTIVDHYFIVTDYFEDISEKLEEEALKNPETQTLQKIQRRKKELANIRKAISPVREAISILEKDTKLIKEGTKRYLRDVYEHIIQLNDTIDAQRDFLGNIMDLYLSGVSNRMNEVMKVLTIIATIFIPLTFIAGVYGMNFEFMPELHWKHGYIGVWILMIAIFAGMIFYFKKKKWL